MLSDPRCQAANVELAPWRPAMLPGSFRAQGRLILVIVVGLACLAAVVLAGLPQSQFDGSLPAGLAVVLAMLWLRWLVTRHRVLRDQPVIRLVVLAVLLLRLSAALAISRWWWWPQVAIMPRNDWDFYESLGWGLAQSGMSPAVFQQHPLNEVGIAYLIGALYTAVGRNPLIVTMLFSGLSAWIALDLAELVLLTGGGKRAAAGAAVLAGLLPIGLFFSAMPTKDVLVLFFFMRLLVLIRRAQEPGGRTVRIVSAVFVLLLAMSIVRATSVPILFLSLAGISAFVAPKARRRLVAFTVALTLAGSVILVWRTISLREGLSLSPILLGEFVFNRTGRLVGTLSEAGLMFTRSEADSLVVGTFWDGQVSRVYLIPLRAMLLMFAPFPPTNFSSLDVAAASLNTLVIVALVPAAWVAVTRRGDGQRAGTRSLSWLWVPIAVYSAALSAGLPFWQARYSLPIDVLLVGLAVNGLRRSRRLAVYYLFLPFALVIALMLYTLVKDVLAFG